MQRQPNIRLTGKPGPQSGLGIILASPTKPFLFPTTKAARIMPKGLSG